MRRVIISIILGLVFPFVCLMAIGAISDYLPKSLTELKIGYETGPGIIWMPFMLPLNLLDILTTFRIIKRPFSNLFIYSFFAFFVLFDWILYGTIFYWLLGRFKKFQKQPAAFSENPPPPPEFWRFNRINRTIHRNNKEPPHQHAKPQRQHAKPLHQHGKPPHQHAEPPR